MARVSKAMWEEPAKLPAQIHYYVNFSKEWTLGEFFGYILPKN
jgi:hypothetical protein